MKLSVVISVFNEEQLIKECLDSLFTQSRLPDEVIIVDNNCTDKTIEIARKYKIKIVTEAKQGIWQARYTGFNAAQSDVIICTDADARLDTNWLQEIESYFKNNNVIGVAGPGIFYDGNKVTNWLAQIVYMQAYFTFVGLALRHKPLFGSNMAFLRTGWNKVKDEVHCIETVYDDMDLSYHLTKYGTIAHHPGMANRISIRPLKSFTGMLKRYKKGLRSVFIHWPDQAPWRL